MSLTSIYLSSVGLIGIMLLAAFQNRRSGWSKPQNGGAIPRAVGAGQSQSETVAPVPDIPPMHGPAEFTTQLVNLQRALHQHGRVAPLTEPALKHAELKRST